MTQHKHHPIVQLYWRVILLLMPIVFQPGEYLHGQTISKDLFFSTLELNIPRGFGDLYEDSRGYLWICTGGGLCRYDGTSVELYKADIKELNSLSSSHIFSITEDPTGSFWISTHRGLNAYDPVSGEFRHFFSAPTDTTTISSNRPRYLTTDSAGYIWMGHDDEAGLNRLDPQRGTCQRYYVRSGQTGQLQGRVRGRICSQDNHIYLSTTAGFEYFDTATGIFHFFPLLNEQGDTIYYEPSTLVKSEDGRIWIPSPQSGFRIYHPATNTMEVIERSRGNGRPLPRIEHLAIGKDRRIWLSNSDGIWSLSPDLKELQKHQLRFIKEEPVTPAYGPLYVDRFGQLWLRNHYYNPRSEQFTYHQIYSTATQEPLPVYSLLEVNDSIVIPHVATGYFWYNLNKRTARLISFPKDIPIGESNFDPRDPNWHRVKKGGLHFYNAVTGEFAAVIIQQDGKTIGSNMSTVFDQQDNMWISTWGWGLIRIRAEVWKNAKGPITDFDQWLPDSPPPTVPTRNLLNMTVDSDNQLWVACSVGGLIRIDATTGKWQQYNMEKGVNSVSDTYTFAIVEGKGSLIWISTNSGGLNKYDKGSDQFTIYDRRQGMLDENLFVIDSDADGHLWMNTNTGLIHLDPVTETFSYYNQHDGVITWETNGFVSERTNRLIWGGNTGFLVASVDSLKKRPLQASELVITAIRAFDPDSNYLQLLPYIEWQDQTLKLSHRQNAVEIQFAVLDFRNAVRHRYQYALSDGGLPQWIDLGPENQVRLNQLAPGDYLLYLRGRNSDYLWSALAHPLKIVIHPPWWKTSWAYLIYALSLLGVAYYFYQLSLKRRLVQQEARQIRALDALKTRFFTNITHEFRTPLTVILGMTEAQDDIPRAMKLIRRNGQQLLHLINQLLDLAKLEAGSLHPKYKQVEIVSLTRYLGESFQSQAESKQIELQVNSQMDRLSMDMDEEQYGQIVFNLLSNAMKFTPKGGSIRLQLTQEDQLFKISVKDTGPGIPADALPQIFDRFYQADHVDSRTGKGTGIGLAIVKELTHLLDGHIQVHSRLGHGTTFELSFPIRRKAEEELKTFHPILDRQPVEMPAVPLGTNGDSDAPLLLLIEDNPDLVFYMQTILHDTYQLEIAANGREGIDKAIEKIPDMIISDVMMPEKDGFAVVETLKQDERTCHIPIILLTAKAGQEDRISGLKNGADVYLMKPFDKAELLVRLEQLIALRKRLQAHYTANIYAVDSLVSGEMGERLVPNSDDEFLQKIHRIIEQKIDDPQLDLDYLCREVHLSPTQLFRKMKALTGEPPMSFIRKVRLYKARELLRSTNLTIAEIAYQSGFTDPHYFSRAFSKEFGDPPSYIRK